MEIKDDVVQFARTLIKGDFEANVQVEEKLDKEGWDGWPQFLGALFVLSVMRRFRNRYDEPEVIRFVAELRASIHGDGPAINQGDAELLIRAAFDPPERLDIHPETVGHIQTHTVYAILSEENLPDDELGSILAQARSIAAGYRTPS